MLLKQNWTKFSFSNPANKAADIWAELGEIIVIWCAKLSYTDIFVLKVAAHEHGELFEINLTATVHVYFLQTTKYERRMKKCFTENNG